MGQILIEIPVNENIEVKITLLWYHCMVCSCVNTEQMPQEVCIPIKVKKFQSTNQEPELQAFGTLPSGRLGSVLYIIAPDQVCSQAET